ncbi:endonuclease [Moritella sp. Urea-trap-13]|uniref:endonuclease n=1 Tax=Moritella sp. Urea-trap-13 TaxID=2058327 RepID=UPI000C32D634|nr:endonuclease [Moritella sp. Urea-trap-13]PKH09667.1 endonuclease I [Moritella sp. Urea-trap-13]
MLKQLSIMVISTTLLLPSFSYASDNGNQTNQSFSKAKKMLERQVYNDVPKLTIYCLADFNSKKKITDHNGFTSTKHVKRQAKVEWEHVVPAENFGRNFSEWREGDNACVNSKGKSFKGRRCAEKMNIPYRYMQADMYNLYPAIGAVNALRSNYNFASQVTAEKNQFGSCPIKINNKTVQPPNYAKGQIARAYLYMEAAYPAYNIGRQKRELQAWDKQYPVTQTECRRTQLIESLQGNENRVVKSACIDRGLW